MKKRVILISLDALSCTDFDVVKDLPNFGKIIRHGAYCAREYSVYPSLTFPCHASIATGCNPGTHGIVSNYLFEPGVELPRWNFFAANLKRKAIWDYAAENHKSVLNLSWPVSSSAKIRWSMPEMTPAKPKLWTRENFFRQLGVFFRYGTPVFAFRSLLQERELVESWFTGKQPDLDRHMISQFQRCVRQYPFDIALFHVFGMDNVKHNYGIHSQQARESLELYDAFVGNLMEFVDERTAVGEEVSLMITGDHSQLPVEKSVYLNMMLKDMGLCRFDDNGKLLSWDAFFGPCDGSAYLYVKDSDKTEQIVSAVQEKLTRNPAICAVFTPEQAAALGADPDCALMVEAADGYGTETKWYNPEKLENNYVGSTHCKGLHGYLPDHADYQTMFFCYGPAVAEGYEIKEMCITDITPSICWWMNMKQEETDGKPIPRMFKSK